MKRNNENQQRIKFYEQSSMRNENEGQRFLRLNEVLNRVGLSRTTLYERIKDGRFPKQVRISMRSIAFLESEIDEWMDKAIADSRKVSNK